MANHKSIDEQFKDIFKEMTQTLNVDIEGALTEASEVLKKELELSSPKSGEIGPSLKDSWRIKKQYKRVRYVGNTKTVSGKGGKNIPLSNILEYAERSPHKGFIRNTFERSKTSIRDVFVNKLKKGK